jgi:hypothetical protein
VLLNYLALIEDALWLVLMNIPVTFRFEGKVIKAFFTQPFGMPGQVWFLSVKNYCWGQLMYYPKEDVWRFHNYQGKMKELAEYFGSVIINWYQ